MLPLRYIKDWVIRGTSQNEAGWSISVSMQPIDTKLSKKMKLVTKAHNDVLIGFLALSSTQN